MNTSLPTALTGKSVLAPAESGTEILQFPEELASITALKNLSLEKLRKDPTLLQRILDKESVKQRDQLRLLIDKEEGEACLDYLRTTNKFRKAALESMLNTGLKIGNLQLNKQLSDAASACLTDLNDHLSAMQDTVLLKIQDDFDRCDNLRNEYLRERTCAAIKERVDMLFDYFHTVLEGFGSAMRATINSND